MNWIEHRRRLARRRRMARVLLGMPVLLFLSILAGAALPAARVTSAALILARSPESVWLVLADVDGMPGWRSDLDALERIPDQDGRPAWKEFGPHGVRVVQLVSAEPPRRLVTRRMDGNRPAFRTVELAQREGKTGTVVKVTDHEEVGNLLRRVLARLPLRREARRFLRDLAQALNGPRREVASAPE